MVGTRTKNKNAHPAAPVMTEAAKIKAGIPGKRRTRKPTKDEQIRELQARLAAVQRPDEAAVVSKEPLVSSSHFRPSYQFSSQLSSREIVALLRILTQALPGPRLQPKLTLKTSWLWVGKGPL